MPLADEAVDSRADQRRVTRFRFAQAERYFSTALLQKAVRLDVVV